MQFSCRLDELIICAKTTCFILLSIQANTINWSDCILAEIKGYRLTFDHQDNKHGQPTGLVDTGTVDNNYVFSVDLNGTSCWSLRGTMSDSSGHVALDTTTLGAWLSFL